MLVDIKNILIISLILFCTNLAVAQEFPDAPSNEFLRDASGARNAISIDCQRIYQSTQLKCKFFQMTVSYKLEPDELEASISAEIEKVNTDPEALGDDPLEEVRKICPADNQDRAEIEGKLRELSKGPRKDYAEGMLQVFKEACNAKDISDAKRVYIKLVTLGSQNNAVTCKVWPNHWEEIFEYHNTLESQYWVTKSEPQGECGIINVSTLKKDGKFFWKYDSRRVVTNSEGGGALLSCKNFEDRTVSYTWNPREHDVNCKVITFSVL